jgi:hypothetical protein
MLRFLIGTGALLMVVGFGAAGWQYWQGMPAAEAAEVEEAPPAGTKSVQRWMISPTGGLVPQETVRVYLTQDRFVPGRSVVVTRSARLSDLLLEGEKLPELPYLQVLADIRAPKIAENLCAALTASIALDCAVQQARVVEDSVDPAAGTASFHVELVFREKLDEAELPDLAAHVLQEQVVLVDLEPGAAGSESAEAALAAAAAAARAACQGEAVGQACRISNITVNWKPGQPVALRAGIAWLDPLPEGVFTAPPLEPAPEG